MYNFEFISEQQLNYIQQCIPILKSAYHQPTIQKFSIFNVKLNNCNENENNPINKTEQIYLELPKQIICLNRQLLEINEYQLPKRPLQSFMLQTTIDKEGFSSEQQINLQTVDGQENEPIDEIQADRIRLHALYSHPAEQIRKTQYSLEPDMMSGWKSKIYIPKPIPLIFYNDELDYAIQRLIKMKTFRHQSNEENNPFIQLVYLGPRYESTYSAWYQKPFDFPYTHLNKNKRLKFTDREFVGQYWNAETQNHLHFDSFFESGNLDVVFKIGEFEYDLFMRVDSNTRGHLHWYNFKVKNMIKGSTYKFNICNFLKSKSLYSRGMKPFIFSKKQHEQDKKGWSQGGLNIKFQKKTPKSFRICSLEIQRKPHRLSFDFECEYQNDEVQFAYCVPYEYSRLKDYLQRIEQRCNEKNFIKVSRLAYSLGGLEIPVVTITLDLKQRGEDEYVGKKLIVASGRIHPGESNGSFMMEGFIDYLCGDSQQAEQLRNSIVFKLIPMLNPDGVVVGNYRTSLSGKDLNRQFIHPDQEIFPQNYHLKKYLSKLRTLYKKDFLLYLDFHGHSTKKNCFTYGPQFSITNNNYYQSRIFPKLVSMQTEMFRFFSCIFKISECKERTLRAVLLKYFQLDLVYTIEVSNGSFYNHQLLQDVLFDDIKWIEMGTAIGKSVNQYVTIFKELEKFKQAKKEERLKQKKNKEKLKLKSTLLKKETPIFSKQRISLSPNKTTFTIKSSASQYSSNKLSPERRKALGYQSNYLESRQNQKQNHESFTPNIRHRQNPLMIPQLQDEKLNSLLKQIYSGNKKGNEHNQDQDPQNQNQEKRSNRSDDNISEGGSDSSSSSQDLSDAYKKQLFKSIKSGSQKLQGFNSLKKKKNLNIIESPQKYIEDQSTKVENETDLFFTDFGGSSNSLDQLRPQSKINSLKMNQLRSKKHIYLKKKSYQMNLSGSPKKQGQSNLNLTAKIVNFQFSLNPIKNPSRIWHQKQLSTNSIHSIFKQSEKEKIETKIRHIPVLQHMSKSFTQREDETNVESNPDNFKKRLFSAQKEVTCSTGSITGYKSYNMALLRKTQEKKLKVNTAFYKSSKPDKEIGEGNLRGKRIMSTGKRQICIVESFSPEKLV